MTPGGGLAINILSCVIVDHFLLRNKDLFPGPPCRSLESCQQKRPERQSLGKLSGLL